MSVAFPSLTPRGLQDPWAPLHNGSAAQCNFATLPCHHNQNQDFEHVPFRCSLRKICHASTCSIGGHGLVAHLDAMCRRIVVAIAGHGGRKPWLDSCLCYFKTPSNPKLRAIAVTFQQEAVYLRDQSIGLALAREIGSGSWCVQAIRRCNTLCRDYDGNLHTACKKVYENLSNGCWQSEA